MTVLAQIARLPVTVGDPPRVERFLNEHPAIDGLAGEALEQLPRYIPDAEMRLSLVADPELDGADHLYLGVSTGLSEDKALAALERFDTEWWVEHASGSDGLLNIDLDETT